MKTLGTFPITIALIVGLVSCVYPPPYPEQYNLTVSSTEGGSVTTPGEGTFTYYDMEVVELVAESDEGYQFVEWTGDVRAIGDVNAANTTIAMSDNYAITANFQQIILLLEQVIAAASEEGEVVFFCGGMAADAETLMTGIYDEFGVLLDVTVVPGKQNEAIAQMVTEKEQGLPPSYDFMDSGIAAIIHDLRPNDLQTTVDWEPFFEQMGFSEDLCTYYPPPIDNVVTTADICCILYNTSVMSEADLPQTMDDFLDPEYNGKFSWLSYATLNSIIAYIRGLTQEEAVEWLCGIRANGAQFITPINTAAQVALGTLDFGDSLSKEYKRIKANDPDAPIGIAFPHDFMYVQENFWSVFNGCGHPNAAILAILWILTPDGQDWLTRVYGAGNPNDPLSNEAEWIANAEANNWNVVWTAEVGADFFEWYMTEESVACSASLEEVIDTGIGCS